MSQPKSTPQPASSAGKQALPPPQQQTKQQQQTQSLGASSSASFFSQTPPLQEQQPQVYQQMSTQPQSLSFDPLATSSTAEENPSMGKSIVVGTNEFKLAKVSTPYQATSETEVWETKIREKKKKKKMKMKILCWVIFYNMDLKFSTIFFFFVGDGICTGDGYDHP
jgi:hypothetical protein